MEYIAKRHNKSQPKVLIEWVASRVKRTREETIP